MLGLAKACMLAHNPDNLLRAYTLRYKVITLFTIYSIYKVLTILKFTCLVYKQNNVLFCAQLISKSYPVFSNPMTSSL